MDEIINNLSVINLSAMDNPKKCNVIWHYAEMSFSPESFSGNIDWNNEVIKLKKKQTQIFLNFTYYTSFRKSIPLYEITTSSFNKHNINCSTKIPRAQMLKDWAKTVNGYKRIFEDGLINDVLPENYLVLPVLDHISEIHMCIIGLIKSKLTSFKSAEKELPIQRIIMLIDLAHGFQNHLTISGIIQTTGVNIFKALFENIKNRPATYYLDFGLDIPPVPFIQLIYNAIPYFPELQVIWTPNHIDTNIDDNIPIAEMDKLIIGKKHHSGLLSQLEKRQKDWLKRRENSAIFKIANNKQKNIITKVGTNNIVSGSNQSSLEIVKYEKRFTSLCPDIKNIIH